MKLFLIGWAESCPELVDTVEELEKNGHEIVYWARNEDPVAIDHSRFPNTAFHSYHEARNSIPTPQIPCDKYPHPDESLLKELASTELLVLPMMNKIYQGLSVSERRQIFIQFIRYWLGLIDQYKPELIFFNTTPHAPLYFALYGLAKHLGIKTSMFEFTWVEGRMIWMDDIHEGSLLLRDNFARLRDSQISTEDLPVDIRKFYERHNNPEVDTAPSYLTDGLKKYTVTKKIIRKIRNFFTSIFKPKLFFSKVRRFYINLPNMISRLSYYFRHNLPRAYRSLQVSPDFNRKFIYAPLHLQPECTTNPIGETFQDQVFLIETLADSLPNDWVIYVKEHPFQWPYYGNGFTEDRYHSYYGRIARIPNVFLVPIETPTLDLIGKSQAVATVSGTAGWETVLRGKKPALVFGRAWYQYAPGVMRIKSKEDCRKAFGMIANGFSIPVNDILAYLLALDKSSLVGYIDSESKKVSKITPKENMQNFLDAFLLILK